MLSKHTIFVVLFTVLILGVAFVFTGCPNDNESDDSQKFVNEAFGYEVQALKDGSFTEEQKSKMFENTVVLSVDGEDNVVNRLTINVIDGSLENHLDSLEGSLDEIGRNVQEINDITWTIIKHSDKNNSLLSTSAFTEKNGKVYQIVYMDISEDKNIRFEEALQTFRFLK